MLAPVAERSPHRLCEARYGLQTLQNDSAVDVDAPLFRIGLHLMVLATFYSAIPEHRVVLWVDRVHEADDGVSPVVLLELFVLGEKHLLGLRVSIAGDEFWLLVG